MTSLWIEHLEPPTSRRQARAVSAGQERVADTLAGRTVWCLTGLPDSSRSSTRLRIRLDGAGPGVAAVGFQLAATEPLRRLAERLGRALAGTSVDPADLGAAERFLYAQAPVEGDAQAGMGIRPGDIVVAHDALGAITTPVLRERGAHAVWGVRMSHGSRGAARAFELLRSFTEGTDAYLLRWLQCGSRGPTIESVAAAMPASGIVAAKEFALPSAREEWRRLLWRTALAEIVRSDREECVGGTLHAKPAVAVH